MTTYRIPNAYRDIIWLTASYSVIAGGWFIDNTYPPFIKREDEKEFYEIEGTDIVYMVRGFDHYEDAKQFAIDYHEAKADGFVHRIRLD